MEDHSFEALRDAPLHRLTPAEWADWYPRMAIYLDHADPGLRDAALERLVMATFWAERRPEDRERREAALEGRRRRAAWLLETVGRAHGRHPDLLPALLRRLRWHGDDEPFPEVLLPWLRDLRAALPPGLPDELAEGAEVLIGGLDPPAGATLPPLLDHPSDYVRGCAAYVLGGRCSADGAHDAVDPGLLAALTEAELARPGIAGPFWSGLGVSAHPPPGLDPLAWMLDIIERRSGPEPADTGFNGVDFHVHELAAGNPDAIRRLARAGRTDLAIEAALEIHGAVEAVAPVLREFTAHPDPAVAHAARVHLARYHGEAGPGAAPDRLQHVLGWRPGVDAFVIRWGDPSAWSSTVVLFPADRGTFDDDAAWAAVDAALPPDLRGDPVRHALARGAEGAGPVRTGRGEVRAYASGAEVTLSGDLDARRWTRIEVHGGRLRDRWQPFTGTGPEPGR